MILLARYKLRWIIGLYFYIIHTKQYALTKECDSCLFTKSSNFDSVKYIYGLGRHASSRFNREAHGGNYFGYDKVQELIPEGSTKLDSTVNKALDKAFDWVMTIRDGGYGWGQDTTHTIVALILAKPSWFQDSNLEAKLIAKNFDLDLIFSLWKHKEIPLKKGLLALNILAMIGLCEDPRSFYSKDILAMMERTQSYVDFEEVFGIMASCLSEERLRKNQLRKVIFILRNSIDLHSIDTQSIALLGLRCAQLHASYDVSPYIEEGIEALMRSQDEDGSFASNLHSTAIALQALISNGYESSWNATKAQEYIISHQRDDGSFGNIFDTNTVLPGLAGNTLLDIKKSPCNVKRETDVRDMEVLEDIKPREAGEYSVPKSISNKHGIMPKTESIFVKSSSVHRLGISSDLRHLKMVNITYIIWCGNDAYPRYNMTLTVPQNTSFLTIMKMAAEMSKNFEFEASNGSNGYYVHTLAGLQEQKSGFWFWLLYRMREPPDLADKPSNILVSSEGIIELKPKDGDFILFWYRQI